MTKLLYELDNGKIVTTWEETKGHLYTKIFKEIPENIGNKEYNERRKQKILKKFGYA